MKYIPILFIIFILFASTSCMFDEYRDTTEIMPGNADMVLNINIPFSDREARDRTHF